MLLARKHAWAVSEGRKTVFYDVQRPKNCTAGKIYKVQIRPAKKGGRPENLTAPCQVELVSCQTIALGWIDDADARRAGYRDLEAFKMRWLKGGQAWDPKATIWRSEIKKLTPGAESAHDIERKVAA